jgi:uncharacterized SAM-binding protein YcdF (DUF218 family)
MANSKPIYSRAQGESSNRPRATWIFLGAISGAASWLFLQEFGVPQIFGIGSDAGLIPLAALGALLAWTRLRSLIPVISFALLVLHVIVAYTGVAAPLAQNLIRRDEVPANADAVVALSAGVTADGHLTQQGLDRTITAVELVERGIAPVLLFTREERKTGTRKSNNTTDQILVARLARLRRVMTTRPVKSTHDEAVAVASIARHRGWKRVILVTSPFHSRRACATFEHAGVTVSCVPSDSRDVAINRLIYPHDRIVAFGLWLYETAGTLRYKQRGWI